MIFGAGERCAQTMLQRQRSAFNKKCAEVLQERSQGMAASGSSAVQGKSNLSKAVHNLRAAAQRSK